MVGYLLHSTLFLLKRTQLKSEFEYLPDRLRDSWDIYLNIFVLDSELHCVWRRRIVCICHRPTLTPV